MTSPALDRKTDAEVAAELGCSVRWLRTHVLDVTPHSHLRIGRRRYLLPRHVEIVVKAMENTASLTQYRTQPFVPRPVIRTTKPSKSSALEEALKLARGN